MTVTFAGMPDEGLAFLEDLEERNTKAFFDANRGVFKEQVQAPFAALVEAAAAGCAAASPTWASPRCSGSTGTCASARTRPPTRRR